MVFSFSPTLKFSHCRGWLPWRGSSTLYERNLTHCVAFIRTTLVAFCSSCFDASYTRGNCSRSAIYSSSRCSSTSFAIASQLRFSSSCFANKFSLSTPQQNNGQA
uniref:Putative salivary lipocalin n=1 Tax=Ixodes ricinus TaxID=34613 RepID=A0A0K8RDL3_IXORI